MAKILIADEDPAFTALLEDQLRLAGHQVELVGEASLAVAKAADTQADLMILQMASPAVTGVVLVRALRRQPETASMPVVVLTASQVSAERVTLFRAGADEVLSQPLDPEEVLLRIARLLGSSQREASMLSGDLAAYPVWELLQYLDHAHKSGELQIHGPAGSGRLRLVKGRVIAARWSRLAGEEALLAVLDQEQGRFSFLGKEPPEPAAGGPRIEDRRLVMEASRLKDELERHRAALPAAGVPLRCAGGAQPPRGEELGELPAAEIVQRVGAAGSLRLYDLLAAEIAAPQKVRLAVALLVEQGVLATEEEVEAFPTTRGIESSLLLDLAVGRVMTTARQAGVDASPLPCLVLAGAGVWGELRLLVERLPGSDRLETIRKLADQLRMGRGGRVQLDSPEGKLSLHVQTLREPIVRQLGSILPVCAGVVVWLEGGGGPDGLEELVRQLRHRTRTALNVVFIAPSETARRRLATLLPDGGFRVLPRAPESLLGLLRLFQLGRGAAAKTEPAGVAPQAG